MNESTRLWEAVAIDGSAPAPSDIVGLIVRDADQKLIARLGPGDEPLLSALPEDELSRLAEERYVSKLVAPVMVRSGDLAMYVAPELWVELERSLNVGGVWPKDLRVGELAERPGFSVGLGSRNQLEEIARGWANQLQNAADERAVSFFTAGTKDAAESMLKETERLARLARYCVGAKTAEAYALWLRIGFSQKKRLQVTTLSRTYEIPIKRDFRCTRETFEGDIATLAMEYEERARRAEFKTTPAIAMDRQRFRRASRANGAEEQPRFAFRPAHETVH